MTPHSTGIIKVPLNGTKLLRFSWYCCTSTNLSGLDF